MRILAVDVGTGTQDILLFDSELAIENCIQMIMPSPTMLVAEQVRKATRERQAIVLSGVTMGGGPSMWAVEDHLRANLPVYATPKAAQSFDDDLNRIAAMGIQIVDDPDAVPETKAISIRLKDFWFEPIISAIRAFGVDAHPDAVAVAVFDHGAAPPDQSDRRFRFQYLAETLERDNDLAAFAHTRDQIPPSMTRLAAVAETVPNDLPLVVMDTGPAAALGALEDPVVAQAGNLIVVNVGNFHALAFHLEQGRIVGLFEHHTGELTAAELERDIQRLATGEVTNEEVFDDMGHGAIVWPRRSTPTLYAVTGPRRAMLGQSALEPYFAVPHGDMMLAGCFGLLRAMARRCPEFCDAIEGVLGSDR